MWRNNFRGLADNGPFFICWQQQKQQLNVFQSGLMEAVLDRDAAGNLIRKSGIMGIVLTGGLVKPGDEIRVSLPAEPHQKLERV